jgi:hypothetical protein
MLIGTLAASTTTTITLNYLPSVIHFAAATAPSAVKVNVLGDGVLCDLDAVGAAACSAMFMQGRVTNGFYIPLADGTVKGKTVEITITNAVAAAVSLYGYGTQNGSTYIRSLTQLVLASSGVELSNFFQLATPSFVTADIMTITYKNGFNQKMSPEDLRLNVAFETSIQNTVSDLRVPNTSARVKSVSFIPNANQNVYVFKYAAIGNQ